MAQYSTIAFGSAGQHAKITLQHDWLTLEDAQAHAAKLIAARVPMVQVLVPMVTGHPGLVGQTLYG